MGGLAEWPSLGAANHATQPERPIMRRDGWGWGAAPAMFFVLWGRSRFGPSTHALRMSARAPRGALRARWPRLVRPGVSASCLPQPAQTSAGGAGFGAEAQANRRGADEAAPNQPPLARPCFAVAPSNAHSGKGVSWPRGAAGLFWALPALQVSLGSPRGPPALPKKAEGNHNARGRGHEN